MGQRRPERIHCPIRPTSAPNGIGKNTRVPFPHLVPNTKRGEARKVLLPQTDLPVDSQQAPDQNGLSCKNQPRVREGDAAFNLNRRFGARPRTGFVNRIGA